MRNIKICTAFILIVCATNALQSGKDPDTYVDNNSTELAELNELIARRKAYEAYLLLSPYPRHDCLDSVAPIEGNFKANELMDMALDYLRKLIRKENMDRVPIPRFEESFSKKIGFVTVKGSFEGENGWMESTLSIARKGDAQVRLEGTSVNLDSTLGLDILRLGMDYKAKIAFISVKGKLDALVHTNVVAFSGGFDYSSGVCRVFLQTLTLQDLGKIDVHVTGLGKLNWLYSKIVTWVTSRLHNKIKDTVEKELRALMDKELDKIKCPAP